MHEITSTRTESLRDLLSKLALLSEPRSLLIVDEIDRAGRIHPGTLTKILGMHRSTVSRQLAYLRDAGFIEWTQDGFDVFYSIKAETFESLAAKIQDFASNSYHNRPQPQGNP